MQSHRWAAPPTTSRSTIVTSAPRRAACVAAVLPAGPPPRITNRMGIAPRLLRQLRPGAAPGAVDDRVAEPHIRHAGRRLRIDEALGVVAAARHGERRVAALALTR